MAAAMTEPPGPGGRRRRCTRSGGSGGPPRCAVGAALGHPGPEAARVGRQAVDVLEGQAGVGDGLEARIDRQRQGINHQATPEVRAADPDRIDRCSNRSVVRGGRRAGPERLDRRDRPGRPPGDLEQGKPDLPCCSKVTMTSWPIPTSAGSEPTMFVVRRTLASSARATVAMTYGGSRSGNQRWGLTVKPTMVPRPDTAVGWPPGCGNWGRSAPADAPLAAVRAALDAEHAVGPRGPEPLGGRSHLREGSHGAYARARGQGIDIDVVIEHSSMVGHDGPGPRLSCGIVPDPVGVGGGGGGILAWRCRR